MVKKVNTRKIERIVASSVPRTVASNKTKKTKIILTGKGKLISIIACSSLAACSGNFEIGRSDYFHQAGTTTGIQAQGEREIGTINEAKTPEGSKSSYFQLQEHRASIFDRFLQSLKPENKQQ